MGEYEREDEVEKLDMSCSSMAGHRRRRDGRGIVVRVSHVDESSKMRVSEGLRFIVLLDLDGG